MMRESAPAEILAETFGISSPVVARNEPKPLHALTLWGYAGFVIGIAVGLAYTAGQVWTASYAILPFQLVWNLIWAPCVGAIIGRALSRIRSEKNREWRPPMLRIHALIVIAGSVALLLGPFPFPPIATLIWWILIPAILLGVVIGLAIRRTRSEAPRGRRFPQLSVRALMAIIAYIALLLGAGATTYRMGFASMSYLQRKVNAAEMARVFQDQGRGIEADAKLRLANMAEFHAGKIPVGLLKIQRDFLQSLEDDPKVNPAYRKYRRGLIEKSEEQQRIRQEENVVLIRRIVEHFDGLTAKYEWARWHPWIPVEPDPPVPQ